PVGGTRTGALPRFMKSRGAVQKMLRLCRPHKSQKERQITMSTNGKKLTGKVAVVTGASKGIGAAIAKQLADEGAAVVVNYASSKAGADRVVSEIVGRGGKALAVQADLANKADIERLFAEVQRAFGRLDVLVNNA